MKKAVYTAVLAILCGLSVRAEDSATGIQKPNSNSFDSTDSDARKLGVGIVVGEPTGASLKYWLNDTLALDGAVGWSSHDHSDLYVHGDVLWHNFDVFPVSQGRLPVYVGIGGLVRFRDDHRDNQVGVRVPIGVSYMFENAPVDIFAEIAPTIDVVPEARGEITGGIGVRFWF